MGIEMKYEFSLSAVMVLGAISICGDPAIADRYPVSGAWAYVGKNVDVGSDKKNCEAFRRFGLSKLSGNVVGDFTVFRGNRRFDFGGYADDEKQNVSVKPSGRPNEYNIAERFFDDGEGGGRAGYKTRRYRILMISPDRIQIKEGRYESTLVKCDALLSPAPKQKQIMALPKAIPQDGPSNDRPTKSIDLVDLISSFTLKASEAATMLDWHDAAPENTPVLWLTVGLGDCEPRIATKFKATFCRRGRAMATISGRPTHRALQRTSSAGLWDVELLGSRNGATVALIRSDVNSQELDRDVFSKALASRQIKVETLKRSCWETNGTDVYRLVLPEKKPATVAVSYSCGSGGCSVGLAMTMAEGPDDEEFLTDPDELPCGGRG